VLKQYYTPEEVAEFNAGIDELQAIPVTHANYTELGLSTAGGTGAAWEDAAHEAWHGRPLTELAAERQQNRIDMLICGTPKFDRIVRDPKMLAIHTELAGGQCMLSNNYYIEKHGPCHGGGLHHGGFPRMRTFRYGYDHTTQKFDCCECSLVQLSCPGFLSSLTEQSCRTDSTKATIILSDMSTIDKGPFAVVPGSHKAVRVPRLSRASLPLMSVAGVDPSRTWTRAKLSTSPMRPRPTCASRSSPTRAMVSAATGRLGPCWRDSDGRPLL